VVQLQPSSRGAFVDATCAELEPFAWRSLTPEMLARRVLGAVDRHSVATLLQAADPEPTRGRRGGEPVDRGDERVGVLVDFLATHLWRGVTLPCLVRQLLGALDVWWETRQRLEAELRRLVGNNG
jgi:hypothetical protein